jgi:hypothetical protein
MGYASNREPRRLWKETEVHRGRTPCASCGSPARLHSAELPLCSACLDGAWDSSLAEWDVRGADD